LLRKELDELAATRSYWLMLLVIGALVGYGFLTATALYAEASGAGGGPAALAQGLNPLGGIVVPTLGAYDLAAMLLFPFVVIRLVAAERETGALTLILQAPVPLRAVIAAKGIALLVGWMVAGLPGLLALAWWRVVMHGHLYAPEVTTVAIGHLLRGVVTIGIAAAAAALASSAASAAIIALTVTIGTWALDYAAAARGGLFQAIAAYTPSAALRVFELGELRASTVLVMLLIGIGGLAVAAEWLQVGRTSGERLRRLAGVAIALGVCVLGSAQLHASADASEDRRNSFSSADEAALRGIRDPLTVTIYLAAEDPRLADLERGVLGKLRRALADVRVVYAARGRSGLFARAEDHYGEVWYAVGGRQAMSRSATEEIVLETIYEVAGIAKPTRSDASPYPGYPLAATGGGSALIFFVLWPLAVAFTWWRLRRSGLPITSQ
jgi:hypothetical protein